MIETRGIAIGRSSFRREWNLNLLFAINLLVAIDAVVVHRDARGRGVEVMREVDVREVLTRRRLRAERLKLEPREVWTRRRPFPHARALVPLLRVLVLVLVLGRGRVRGVELDVPVDAAHHELLVSSNGLQPALDDDDAERVRDQADACDATTEDVVERETGGRGRETRAVSDDGRDARGGNNARTRRRTDSRVASV
eukprot:30965-Pelagococcus_subviridis.AAC.4